MTGYVQIQVPEAHYRDVLSHLVSLLTEPRLDTPRLEEAQAASAATDHVWSEEVWKNVWPAITESARKIMIVFAEHQGEWVPIAALENSLGSLIAVQSTLSSLTKRMKKYGQSKWPFEVVIDDQTRRAAYKMDEAMATIVLRLAQDT